MFVAHRDYTPFDEGHLIVFTREISIVVVLGGTLTDMCHIG